jgi:hypothetical protein
MDNNMSTAASGPAQAGVSVPGLKVKVSVYFCLTDSDDDFKEVPFETYAKGTMDEQASKRAPSMLWRHVYTHLCPRPHPSEHQKTQYKLVITRSIGITGGPLAHQYVFAHQYASRHVSSTVNNNNTTTTTIILLIQEINCCC